MKIAVIVGPFRDTEEVARSQKADIENIKRVAYISGNTRGYSEIYVELISDERAVQYARAIQMTAAPVSGKIMEVVSFDEVLNSETFKMMGGKEIQ